MKTEKVKEKRDKFEEPPTNRNQNNETKEKKKWEEKNGKAHFKM